MGRPASLVGSREPGDVGIEEKEEDHADDHEVGVDAEEDAAVVPAPTGAHAADVVGHAGDREEGGEDQERVGVILGEVREQEGEGEAEQDQEAAAQEGAGSRIEKGRLHLLLDHLLLTICWTLAAGPQLFQGSPGSAAHLLSKNRLLI